jgi:hypothetical protein
MRFPYAKKLGIHTDVSWKWVPGIREKHRPYLRPLTGIRRSRCNDGPTADVAVAPWHGFSDFLLRVNGVASHLGDVADTKLARTAKPKHVIQLCVYADLLGVAQGVEPPQMHVSLGDGKQVSLRTAGQKVLTHRRKEIDHLCIFRKIAFVLNSAGDHSDVARPLRPFAHPWRHRWVGPPLTSTHV